MKLLYLYISKAGPLQDCELNFDSDWEFHVIKEGSANSDFLLIKFTHCRVLPDDMWKIGDDEGVESISAIIGDNKAGKTSIAMSLRKIYCEAAMIRHVDYKGEFVRYVAVAFVDGMIRLFANQPCAFDGESMKRLSDDVRGRFSDCSPVNLSDTKFDLTECLGYLYYNPVVTTEAAIDESGNDKLHFWDLSATKALSEAQTYEEFRLSQRQKVFNFLHDVIHQHHGTFKEMGMPLPYRAVITKSSEVASHFMSWVGGRAANDNRYVQLRDMMSNQEVIVLMFIDYVFKAFSWADIVEDKTPDEFGYVSSNWLEEEIFSLVLTLGRRMRMTVDTMSTDLVPNEDRIKCVEYALSKISEIAERVDYDDCQVLRMDDFSVAQVKEGLAFFEKYLDCLKYSGFDVYPDGLRFSMSDEQQIDYIWELLIADKNGYVELGYRPHLSSGEMSYFSAFASIYELLSQEGRENGLRSLPKHLLIFLDEAESSLHPELQRKLIWVYNIFLSKFFPEKKFHVIFASHSPQLLSDLPKGNVVFIHRDESGCNIKERNNVSVRNTFGANVYDLYGAGFFMQNGPVGEFARKKINGVLEKLAKDGSDKSLHEDDMKLAQLVGDNFIRKYMESCISSH